jgi:hypothetical protein
MVFSNGHRVESSIECGSEVVDAIACDQGPLLQPRLCLNLDDKSVVGTINVAIAGDDIRIVAVPLGQIGFERIQMLMSPSEF